MECVRVGVDEVDVEVGVVDVRVLELLEVRKPKRSEDFEDEDFVDVSSS